MWTPGIPIAGNISNWSREYSVFEGIYAVKCPQVLEEMLHECIIKTALAIGTVDLWGDIDEHEKGFRAEFAAVRSIDKIIEPSRVDNGLSVVFIYRKDSDYTNTPRALELLTTLRKAYGVEQ